MRILHGGWWKNGSWVITYHWQNEAPTYSDILDRRVTEWLAKNERATARKRPHQVVQMLADEFPELVEIECRNHPGGYGKISRGTR